MPYLVLLAAMLGAAGSPDAQKRTTRTATLAVLVSDPSGAPVGGVLVAVEGAASRSARTEAGRIVFEGLPPGAYRLRFEREGFVTLERELTARAGAPIDVKVTLTPAPAPAPAPEPPPSGPASPQDIEVQPVALDMPSLIEKEFIGREAAKTTPVACAASGTATLIQVREPLATHAHAEADEFVYVIAGEGTAAFAGRQERLHAGVFVLVPRDIAHTFGATGRNPLMLLSTLAGEPCATAR